MSDPNSKVISDLQLYGIKRSGIELDHLVAVICLFFLCHLIQLAAVILLFVSTYKNLMTWEFVKNYEAIRPSPSPVDNSCTAHNPTPPPRAEAFGLPRAKLDLPLQTSWGPAELMDSVKWLDLWWIYGCQSQRWPNGWPYWALLMKRC